MIEIKTTKKTQQVLISIPKENRRFKDNMREALHDIGSEVIKEVRTLIKRGEKTGRIYNIGGIAHRASAPGEAPANLSGELARSSSYKVRNHQEMSVGESAFYAAFLENGTTKMKPRPHLIAAINNQAGSAYVTLERACLIR